MKCNVVMLVHERFALTRQALNTLYANTDPDMYNVTIVDDGKSALIAPVRDNVAVLRVERSSGITGQLRNLGIYWSEKYWGRGDYLYLSDNDVYFTPGWLEALTKAFHYCYSVANIHLLGGWNHEFLQPSIAGFTPQGKIATHDAVTGASQLMRWATWDKYGPLDAVAPGVCKSEDHQFCQNIIKDGGRVGSIYPRLVFNAGLTNSLGEPSVGADVVLKELQEAKKIYPDLYWE